MLIEKKSHEQSERKTHLRVLAGAAQRTRMMPRKTQREQGIPQGTLAVGNVRAKKQTNSERPVQRADESSGATARCTGQGDAICQNVIGRTVTVAVGIAGLGLERTFRGQHRTLALLDEPAGQLRRGIFFQVLIQQFGDFFAQVRGVGQARQLVGLERGARGGEKKFPGSLGTKLGHKSLQSGEMQQYYRDSNTVVIHDVGDTGTYLLWKRVENQQNPLELCSGCAGDYEDPDWTAWEEDSDEEDGAGESREERLRPTRPELQEER